MLIIQYDLQHQAIFDGYDALMPENYKSIINKHTKYNLSFNTHGYDFEKIQMMSHTFFRACEVTFNIYNDRAPVFGSEEYIASNPQSRWKYFSKLASLISVETDEDGNQIHKTAYTKTRLLNDVSLVSKNHRVTSDVIETSIKFDYHGKNKDSESFSITLASDVTDEMKKIWDQTYAFLSVAGLVSLLIILFISLYVNHVQNLINIAAEFSSSKILEKQKVAQAAHNQAMMIANASHELRTPLNAIIGFSEILISEKHGKLSNDTQRDYLQDILIAGKHLLGIINDILDFYKASLGKLKVFNTKINVVKVIEESVKILKPLVEQSEISLSCDIPKENHKVLADAKRLQQCMINILGNAIKFTEKGGSVNLKLTYAVEEGIAYIEVIDSGIGISEEDIPKVLEPFEQLENDLNKNHQGTGLGLPLSNKLVKLMGANMNIYSLKNSGTKVQIRLKLADANQDEQTTNDIQNTHIIK